MKKIFFILAFLFSFSAFSQITISPTTISGLVTGNYYSQALNASGGTLPYIIFLDSGTLPAGTSLTYVPTGHAFLSGTPTTAATYIFSLIARDATLTTGTQSYTVTVASSSTFTTSVTTPKVILTGATSGSVVVTVPAVAGSNTVTIPATTGTVTVGSGVANRVGYWSGTNALTSDADFTFNGTDVTVNHDLVVNDTLKSAGNGSAMILRDHQLLYDDGVGTPTVSLTWGQDGIIANNLNLTGGADITGGTQVQGTFATLSTYTLTKSSAAGILGGSTFIKLGDVEGGAGNATSTTFNDATRLLTVSNYTAGIDASTSGNLDVNTIEKYKFIEPATSATISVTDGKKLSVANTLTLSGTDGTVMTFPSTSATIARTDAANTFTGASTATSWNLVTPSLGVATATTINKTTIVAPVSSATVSVADGKALYVVNTMTLNATDGQAFTFSNGGGTIATTTATATLTNKTLTAPTVNNPVIPATEWTSATHTHLGTTTGGTLTMAVISDLPVLAVGTYTPTLTNTTNVASSTARQCQYMRVGSVVTVSGIVDIDITTTLAATELQMTLPIASNFTLSQNVGGTANDASGDQTSNIRIIADATSDKARFTWIGQVVVTALTYAFTFTYLIQ